MISIYLIACIFLAVLFHYIFIRKDNKLKLEGKIPPGPWRLPIIGNLHQFNFRNPFMTMPDIAEKYGDVCSHKAGFMESYIFSDLALAKELFSVDPAFAGRMNPAEGINDMYSTGQMHGIINTEGEHWEEIRRFTLRQLRDFGFGKSTMESLIMDELTEVLDWMKSQADGGKPIEGMRDKLSIASVNSLWRIISGQRYAHDDPRVVSLTRNVTKAMDEAMQKGGAVFFIPKLKDWMPEWSGYNTIRRVIGTFRATFENAVKEHQETYDQDFSRDFIDVFLKEIKSCTNPKSAFYKELGERQLVAVIADLFQAGTETSSTTLEWTFLYLATFPEVQEKLQQELDSIVGHSRPCSLADRPQMPYAQGVLAEVLRYSSIVPPGVPHRALSDRVFHGWSIPAGTALWVNQYGIHKSKKIWGDPDNFRPERFLSPDGKTFQKHEALIPFSTGRRQCAGETLARDSLFLYLTNIFQLFEICFDPSDPKANPGFDPKPGVLLQAQPFKVLIKEREIK